ncbi:hypothetical protein ACFQ7M_19530 [Streptomyces massasporeus]
MAQKTRIPRFGCAILSIPFLAGAWYILAIESPDMESDSSELTADNLWTGLLFFLLFVAAILLLGFVLSTLGTLVWGREVPDVKRPLFGGQKRAGIKAAKEAKRVRLAKATCRPGDGEDTPGVVHSWLVVDHGEDRRMPDESWGRGRIRWYSSLRCEKCDATGLSHTDWESDY